MWDFIYEREAAGVRVTIVGAKDLRQADLLGHSDPYCICSIPGKKQSQCQTPVIQDSQEPVWNYTYDFLDFAPGDTLQFLAFDENPKRCLSHRRGAAAAAVGPGGEGWAGVPHPPNVILDK